MSCHSGERASGGYTMVPANDITGDRRYTQSRVRIVPGNFANSLLIRKGSGYFSHGGGNSFQFSVNTADRELSTSRMRMVPSLIYRFAFQGNHATFSARGSSTSKPSL